MDEKKGQERRALATFAGSEIAAIQDHATALVYASLPHLCTALGLRMENQLTMIREHAVLNTGLRTFDVRSEQSSRVQSVYHLKVDLVPLWLALIPVNRLKPEKQAQVILYQTQVADVLHRLFGTPASSSVVPEDQVGYREGLAITRLALEAARLREHQAEQLDIVITTLGALDDRLAELEERINPTGYLTPAQAAEVADLVKQVGIARTLHMGTKVSQIGAVYGELYRAFGVTSYKSLTQAQFSEVIRSLQAQLPQGPK